MLQGAAAAVMFPAAVAIVVAFFPVRERGKAMAIFFGISGGLTAIGPIAGGFPDAVDLARDLLDQRPGGDDRAHPDLALAPETERHPAQIDYRGTAADHRRHGLDVLGLQQSGVWGWGGAARGPASQPGSRLFVAFGLWEMRVAGPAAAPADLPRPRLRGRQRGTRPDVDRVRAVLLLRERLCAGLARQERVRRGVYLLYFFAGFVVMAQIGGRVLDRRGARPAVVAGSAIAAVGFYLWRGKLTYLSLRRETLYIILAGGGMGLMLGPASTDAVNRAPSTSYSEVTGITQTARNFGASLGLAVLGTILIDRDRTNVARALRADGVPSARAGRIASSFGQGSAGGSSGGHSLLAHSVALASAHSAQTVFYVMAGVMGATFPLCARAYPRGRVKLGASEVMAAAGSAPGIQVGAGGAG